MPHGPNQEGGGAALARACRAPLLLALLLAAPDAARGQAIPVPLPRNIIFPNYDNVFIGTVEAVEAGAYLARSSDASASFYNPAGLAASEGTSLSISASGFVWSKLESRALGEVASSSQLGGTPGHLALVVGPPLFRGNRLRLGFSVINAVAWTPAGSDQATLVAAGLPPRLTYASQVSLSTVMTSLSVGYRVTPTLRIGASLSLATTSYSDQETLSGALTTATGQPGEFLSTLRASGSTRHALVSCGVQWDVTPRLTLGGLVRSPGLRLGSGSLFTYEARVQSAAGGTSSYFRDDGGAFEYRLPLELSAGVAYRLGPVRAELDVRFHAGEGEYALYRSAQPIQVRTYAPGSPVASSAEAFPSITHSTREVVNLAAGASYQISERLALHAGAFSSRSPVGDPARSAFQKADLLGATLGTAFVGEHWSASLGLAYEFGHSDPVPTDATPGSPTDLDFRALTIFYALGYRL